MRRTSPPGNAYEPKRQNALPALDVPGPSCGARRMAETAALLADAVFPYVPLRQWVISFPFPLRFLFAAHPKAMGKVLGIICRTISTHLIHKAGLQLSGGATGAVTPARPG